VSKSAEEAFGGDIAPSGATLEPNYHKGSQDVVGVPVMEIRDASSSANEETLQFTAGTFLFSGAFWLGIERLCTVGVDDPVAWVCGLSMLFGAVLGFTGYKQQSRRVRRLERYCPPDA
jgi:hypothetical protein